MKLKKTTKRKTKTVKDSKDAPIQSDIICEVCNEAPAQYRDIRDGVVVWTCKPCISK